MNYSVYRERAQGLEEVCRDIAESMGKILQEESPEQRFCLGFHVRHAFDSTAPSVALAANNQSELKGAQEIQATNSVLGLDTLNHVIDSLCYPRMDLYARGPIRSATGLALSVDFGAPLNPQRHPLDEIEDYKSETLLAAICQSVEDDVTRKDCLPNSIHTVAMVLQDRDLWNELIGLEESLMFKGRLPPDFVCGLQKMFVRLGLPTSLVGFRAVLYAIAQLKRYSDRFGKESLVSLCRPANHFGFAVGFTVLADSIPPELGCKLFADLEKRFIEFNAASDEKQLQLSPSCGRRPLHGIFNFSGVSFSDAYQAPLPAKPSRDLVDHIKEIIGQDLESSPLDTDKTKSGIATAIETFIRIAVSFCDEQLEGHNLSFGLMLGSPSLVRFWPGPPPFPACHETDNGYQFFCLEELPKQVHLLESPGERCLVVPYLNSDDIRIDSGIPSFILEFGDFAEEIANDDALLLWPEELRPYIYLTARYRWAVAAVAGPGSSVRLFVGGRLSAIRTGKGWSLYDLRQNPKENRSRFYIDPIQNIREKCPQWNNSPYLEALRSIIELSVQMSPYVREGSHGGFLVYVPVDVTTESEEFWKMFDKKVDRLHDAEPFRGEEGNGRRWISGLNLVRGDAPDNELPTSDLEVAKLALRAATLDGATIFCGAKATVRSFGKRLTFAPDSKGSDNSSPAQGGTKRVTAESFVAWFHSIASESEFPFLKKSGEFAAAIAVSSDGPIRVYTLNTESTPRVERTTILGGI